MASGTPVVAFANSATPEIVGDGAILVPDGNVPALVRAVRSVLDDPAKRNEVKERGLERAKFFTWQRCADLHAEVYRDTDS
jgi:alpha-1,3-rhamnosyl/mannosyltransferase